MSFYELRAEGFSEVRLSASAYCSAKGCSCRFGRLAGSSPWRSYDLYVVLLRKCLSEAQGSLCIVSGCRQTLGQFLAVPPEVWRGHRKEHPCRRGSLVPERMHAPLGREHESPRRGLDRLFSQLELEGAFQDVERLVGLPVDVDRRAPAPCARTTSCCRASGWFRALPAEARYLCCRSPRCVSPLLLLAVRWPPVRILTCAGVASVPFPAAVGSILMRKRTGDWRPGPFSGCNRRSHVLAGGRAP